MAATFIVGDIHGHVDAQRRLLRQARLMGPDDQWCGGDATLWLMGDLFDNGPDGVGAATLAMNLQQQAASAGGSLGVLLGNHEVLFLAAYRLGDACCDKKGNTFYDAWLANGGQPADLERLTPELAAWLGSLPALARVDDVLLAHADSDFYCHYGSSVEEVNQAITGILQSDDTTAWETLIKRFSRHRAFAAQKLSGAARLRCLLNTFGAQRLVHGHTPIAKLTRQPPETVVKPLIYAHGRCINVDHGLYLGGPGFVYRLGPMEARTFMPHYKMLIGERCYLSPMSPEDAEKQAQWENDLRVAIPLGSEAYSVTGLDKVADQLRDAIARETPVFSIVDLASDQVIGRCLLADVDAVNQSAMLGIMIGDRGYWNLGYGQEAVCLLLEYAFNLLNLHSVMLGVFAYNERAIAAYRKVGFQEIGRRREARIIAGQRFDVVLMDILADDFRTLHGPGQVERIVQEDSRRPHPSSS